jgi:AraC-like DNA-binding protein
MAEPLSTDQIFIRKLTDIILTNLGNENFGVKELARESGLSRYGLNRKLHSTSKKTVIQFIREVHLNKALEILQHETYTVAEVAYRTGFGSPNYFNKCFHEYFGFPPGKVRREDSDNQTPNIPAHSITDDLQKKTIWRNYILTLSGILFLILLSGTGGFFIFNKIQKSLLTSDLITSDNRISIAVMPFRNMTNDTTWNIWQESIQQSLISSLSNNKEIKVRQEETINTFLKTKGLTEYAAITPVMQLKSHKKSMQIFSFMEV